MENETLKRGLSARQTSFMALGMAIGVGLFLGSASAIKLAGPSVLLAYVVCGAMVFLIMRALGEMAVVNPIAGSFAAYAHSYMGPLAGYITGWNYWILMVGVGIAETTAVGIYMKSWFPLVPQWVWVFSSILMIGSINLLAVKVYGELEFWFALIKVVTILLMIVGGSSIIVFGFSNGGVPMGFSHLWSHGGWFPNGVTGFILSLPIVAYAFAGAEMVGITAGEAENPDKTIPKAVNSVLWRILIFYVAALGVILSIYPWNEIGTDGSPFVLTFEKLGIREAAGIINFVVITAALSSFNCIIFSGARMLVNLSEKGMAPAMFGRISKNGAPTTAVLVTILCMSVGVLLNYWVPGEIFGWLMSILSFAVVTTWLMILLTYRCYRKLQLVNRPSFQMPFYPLSFWLSMLFTVMVFVNLGLDAESRISIYAGGIWLLLLVANYYRVVKAKSAKLLDTPA
jgi:L-asparagine transporter-like permease